MLNERVWGSNDETVANSDIDLDLAYVTLKKFLYTPLTLIVGRQELRLGSGLVVGDPLTNRTCDADASALSAGLRDLSSRKAFDGIVGILDYSPLTLILGYLSVDEDDIEVSQDDVNAYAINAAYDFGTKDTIGELYLVTKEANKGEVNNYGLRVVSAPLENLDVNGEFAYQTRKGIRDDSKAASSTALLLGATYVLPDVAWTPSIGVDYTRLGENWDVMFEDQTPADIANALFENTNLQVIGVTVTAKPMEDVTAKLRYANLCLVKGVSSLNGGWEDGGYSGMNSDKEALGNELDLSLTYDYTEDVQLGLNLGYLNPGKAFSTSNREEATQVIGSMKVTF